MEIQEKIQDGIVILHVDEQVDSATSPALGDRLTQLIKEGHARLVLDLSDVPYISSAGLRVLSIALKAARASDEEGDLCLTGLSKTVAHAFRISGFDQVFHIYDTVAEAIAALSTLAP